MTENMRPIASISAAGPPQVLDFEELYTQHFGFVWRNVRRMGVPDALIDDAVQDVFVVVHRRLSEFEGRSQVQTWIFGILLRVVQDYRRAHFRRQARLKVAETAPDALVGRQSDGPMDLLARNERVRVLHAILDSLSEDKRAVFVLAELEQMPVVEVAETLGINLNTAYARLRAARHEFEGALKKIQADEGWGES